MTYEGTPRHSFIRLELGTKRNRGQTIHWLCAKGSMPKRRLSLVTWKEHETWNIEHRVFISTKFTKEYKICLNLGEGHFIDYFDYPAIVLYLVSISQDCRAGLGQFFQDFCFKTKIVYLTQKDCIESYAKIRNFRSIGDMELLLWPLVVVI